MNSKKTEERLSVLVNYFLEHGVLPKQAEYISLLEKMEIKISLITAKRDYKYLRSLGIE